MKHILEDLYYGKLYPAEQIVPSDPEYRPTCRKASEELEYFKKILPPEEHKRFDEMSNLFVSTDAMGEYASYLYGFKLGAMLMCELFAADKADL